MKLIMFVLFSIGIIQSAWSQDLQARISELEGRLANVEHRLSILEVTPREVTDGTWTCALVVFDTTCIGTGQTMNIARAIAVKKCLNAGGTAVECVPSSAICVND